MALFLTWQQDPTTTMTIDWHTEPDDQAISVLYYKAPGDDQWIEVETSRHDFPHSDRTIHRGELTGLDPDSYYRFRVGEFERAYKFRTMPSELDRPIRFITGGDTYSRGDERRHKWMTRTNSVAMEYDPEFIAWGGDLSYADGRDTEAWRWHGWFDAIMETLISDEGRVVPILAGIGNHEMRRPHGRNNWYLYDDYEPTDAWRAKNAPYYFQLFAFPGQPGYNVLDFGNYMSFIFLDTDHANPIAGAQARWLERELRERARRNIPHIFPIYHVPGFGSHRDIDGRTETSVRNNWVPLFESYGVRVAFENHDHTYKRTHPIRNGEIADDGVVYIGDGAWGLGTRSGDNRDAWYIKQFASERHAIVVTLDGSTQSYEIVNEHGEIIDTYTSNP